MPSSFIHIVPHGKISFFLWLNNIPLYKYTKYSVSIIHQLTHVVSMSWLVYEHGCNEHFWDVFELVLSFYADKYPEVELLVHMLVLFLMF